MTRPQPGWRVGPDADPDEFTLVAYRKKGAEGELWQASSPHSSGRKHLDWAVKILLPEYIAETRRSARYWRERWAESRLEISQLQMPGILVPTDSFEGPVPHPPGRRLEGRALYLVSPWVDGFDLRSWHRHDRGAVAAADVVARLCRIVEALHARNHTHSDISPANVMVRSDGEVVLIDLTFMRDLDISRNTVVGTPGNRAPEAGSGSTTATDRFSVGTVAYFLLTGCTAPEEGTVEAAATVLRAGGWSQELCGHLTAMLACDPNRRPRALTDWGEHLGRLVEAESGRRLCADVVSDAQGEAVVFTGARSGLSATRLSGAGGRWPGGPAVVRAVAAERDGVGRLVVFAADAEGTLWTAVDGAWNREDFLVRGRPTAVRDSCGAVVCFTVDGTRVWRHTVPPGHGHSEPVPLDQPLHHDEHRVMGATATPDGRLAVLIGGTAGLDCLMLHGAEVTAARVFGTPVAAAAVSTGRWGDLEVLASRAKDGALVAAERLSDMWGPPPDRRACPVPAADLAFVSHRGGTTVAVAGDRGLWLTVLDAPGGHLGGLASGAETAGGWTCLTPEPCDCVALRATRGWPLHLVALSRGRASYWAEDPSGRWTAHTVHFDG